MRIGVCTLLTGGTYPELVKYCRLSLEDYCTRHGYDLCEAGELYDAAREPMWSKVLIMQKFLGAYDYIVWIDADIMIMNPVYTLEYFMLGWMKDRDMLLSIDSGDQINTGMWFVRNCDFTQQLLGLIYSLDAIAGNYHEQGVLNHLYYRNTLGLRERLVIVSEIDQRLFNSTMYIHHIGDFNIHFMGCRNHDLLEVSNAYYPRQKVEESELMYHDRMQWYQNRHRSGNQRYGMPTPTIKIGVCSLAYGDKYTLDVIKYGKLSMEEYCRKWGYDFVFEDKLLDTVLPPHWSKLLLMLQLMRSKANYDYVVWLDSDVMVMNHEISITSLIFEHMKDKHFMLSRDVSGHINTGVWIVRNSEYARQIVELNYNLPELRYRGCEDQDVFNRLYDTDAMQLQTHAHILNQSDQRILNCCIGCYTYGTFLIHFFSIGRETLKQAFNDFYPYQKDNENDDMYANRLEWHKRH